MFRRGGHRPDDQGPSDPTDSPAPDQTSGVEELNLLLEAIEAMAGRTYARHGLPSEPGQYRRSHDQPVWEKVATDLSPAQKFDLILEQGGLKNWHYAAHDSLGSTHPQAEVRQASAILAACRGIRLRLEQGLPLTAQTLSDAIRMGAIFQQQGGSLPAEPVRPVSNLLGVDQDQAEDQVEDQLRPDP